MKVDYVLWKLIDLQRVRRYAFSMNLDSTGIKILLTTSMVLIVLAAIGGYQLLSSRTSLVVQETATTVTGEIIKGTLIQQPITIEGNHLDFIELKIGTYQRTNNGHLTVSILTNDTKTIASTTRPMTSFVDNQWEQFLFNRAVKPGKYILNIGTEDGQTGNTVTVYCSDEAAGSLVPLSINGSQQSGSLSMKVIGSYPLITQLQMICSRADLNNFRGSRLLLIALLLLTIAMGMGLLIMSLSRSHLSDKTG